MRGFEIWDLDTSPNEFGADLSCRRVAPPEIGAFHSLLPSTSFLPYHPHIFGTEA